MLTNKQKRERQIFRHGSTTFFWSAWLFPRNVRRDVFDLYSFVRVADDYVDELPQNPTAFYELRHLWSKSIKSTHFDDVKNPVDSVNQRVVKNMVRLTRTYDFDPKWIEDFLNAMESDLAWRINHATSTTSKKSSKSNNAKHYKFKNSKMLLFYIHGSAEVIGLMMARVMGLSKPTDTQARMLGRSLQSINFIRDISEDTHVGRCYFINSDFQKFGLSHISKQSTRSNPEGFKAFIREQIDHYREYRALALEGFRYMPWRCRIAVKTALDLYDWTASKIERDPFIVFEKKLKPSKLRILKTALSNIFTV